MRAFLAACCGLFVALSLSAATKPLQIYFIDVEGGQSTLFVPPSGQSLLIDTGWPGNNYRDVYRIQHAMKLAKIKKLDYVLITHFHTDHAGGAEQLASKVPIGTFIDHGETRETGNAADYLYKSYQKAIANSQHMVVKPGDTIPVKGLDITVVSADGNLIDHPLPGAGQPNAACNGVEQKPVDKTENARSVGTVITFGKLRIVDLGDLTWDKELGLMCPDNKLGHADLLVVSHHGIDQSNSPALVHGLAPRVAVMDNGAKKGAVPSAWDVVKSSPGLEDLWQLHFADAGGKEHNVADAYIANTDEADTGFEIKVTANEDGSFEVYNARNKNTKQYPAR
ncbi:MAG TPA: MBL fold metallo-hydrolase [Bryobacteraceae bacterium]|nr:MBL fold metallo-hydrolase [Bryobacteraceae bacterium]